MHEASGGEEGGVRVSGEGRGAAGFVQGLLLPREVNPKSLFLMSEVPL